MIKASLRILAGIVIGLVVAFILVVGVEGFSAVVHPLPKDFGGTMEEMCRHVERYPQWVLAAVVPMWAVAALVSTWIAQRIGSLVFRWDRRGCCCCRPLSSISRCCPIRSGSNWFWTVYISNIFSDKKLRNHKTGVALCALSSSMSRGASCWTVGGRATPAAWNTLPQVP